MSKTMQIKLPITVFHKFKPNYMGCNTRDISFYKIEDKVQTIIFVSRPKILDELNAIHNKTVITLPIKTK